MSHRNKAKNASARAGVQPARAAITNSLKSEPARLLPLGAFMLAGLSALAPNAMAQAQTTETVKELPTVQVQGNVAAPQETFRATTTRVGKVLQDPQDIPQAITSVTQTIMDQQQVGSLREAMRNVSGVSFNAAEGGRSGDNMNLRGFYTFGDMYLDGIRDTAQYNRETFNLEQIDVLRGAGAMLFGRGQAGGVINQVTKTPKLYDQSKVSASFGNNRYQEQTGDFNKPLGETTAIRINAMNRDEGNWRVNPTTGAEAEIHRQGLGVSLGLNLQTDNQFWVNYVRTLTKDNPDYGVSFDASTRAPAAAIPASTFFGTSKTFDNSDTTMTTLQNELRLTPDSQLRTQLRVGEYNRSYWAKTPSATVMPDVNGSVGGNVTRTFRYKTTTLQSDYSTKFKTWDMAHELISGVEYLNEDSYRNNSLTNFGTTGAPDYRPYAILSTATPTTFKSDSYAVYVQDTVEFIPQWKFTAGIRRDQMDAKYSSTTAPSLSYGQNSYRTALSFHPNDDTHYYLAWSDSFSPTADLYQLTIIPQPPERSQVVELGAKWLLLEGDLSFRAALYRANKDWERNTDLESTSAILTKKRRTDGLELEVAGRITEDWEVFAGVAFMDARIVAVAENYQTNGTLQIANQGYAGQKARNAPDYTFNLWSTYKLDGNWKVAGGIEAKASRAGVNPSGTGAVPTLNGEYYPNTAPAYVRYDAMAEYTKGQWNFRLNLKNVFDTVYYDAIYDNGGFTIPGPRRTAILTAEYKL